MPGELADGDVHSEADAEVWGAGLARDLRGRDLALEPAAAEAARDQDPVHLRSSASTSGSLTVSESIHSIFTRQPWWMPL